jgi:anti-sigma factor RsiW
MAGTRDDEHAAIVDALRANRDAFRAESERHEETIARLREELHGLLLGGATPACRCARCRPLLRSTARG